MIQAIQTVQHSVEEQSPLVAEISIEEIEARENALSDTVYCCILNVAF